LNHESRSHMHFNTVSLFRTVYNELIQPFIDTLFPPVCAICGALLSLDREIVCVDCVEKLTLAQEGITLPLTDTSFNDVIVLCEYDNQIRSLIHLLKYNQFIRVTQYLAELAHRKKCIKRSYDYIIPVPLHHIKLRERGYNQSAELAQHLALLLGIPYTSTILNRHRYTPSQTQFSREERFQNVVDAFTCSIDLYDKSILLVDDVVTTGSTVEACARVLKFAHARRVDIFALANPTLNESKKNT
jgi:competence protein ComFC